MVRGGEIRWGGIGELEEDVGAGLDWNDLRRAGSWWCWVWRCVPGGWSSSAPSDAPLPPRAATSGASDEAFGPVGEASRDGRRPVGLVSGRPDILLFIQAAVVLIFCRSFGEGSSGRASTAAMRKRMSSRMEAVAAWICSASSHEENRGRGDMSGVLRASRKGIWLVSWNSNSLPPRRKGPISNDKAIATSEVMASLLIRPCSPSVRNPPLSLIISLSPRRCARRSFVSPQYHSLMMSCTTPAIPSSLVDDLDRKCSFSSLMACPLCAMATVLSRWPVWLSRPAAV